MPFRRRRAVRRRRRRAAFVGVVDVGTTAMSVMMTAMTKAFIPEALPVNSVTSRT